MRAEHFGLLPLLLFLSACALRDPSPALQETPQERLQEQVQKQSPKQAPAEEQDGKQQPRPEQGHVLRLSRMLASLDRIASSKAEEAKQLLKQRQRETAELDANDRFELVLLLSRMGADDTSLKQAQQLLDELETEPRELGVHEILLLQQRILRLEQRYRTERRKSVELNKKIERLKGLEQELDESNRRNAEPLPANRVPTQ